MPIANPSNFRDLGEYVSAGPARGRLFRSDHLGSLSEHDARQIRELGIARVLDFRGEKERMSQSCSVPGVTVHSLSIEPTIVQVLQDLLDAGTDVTGNDVVEHMCDTYRGFVRGNSHRFAEFFSHLLESNQPTVFHCTAGKDRTGFAAALILHALDVPKDEILHDYLMTNERLKPVPLTGGFLPRHVAEVLFRVQPEFLAAAYEAVDEDYGGIDAYLRKAIGLGDAERQRLKALYRPAPG
jgi:protein-tyrosine phosphatase